MPMVGLDLPVSTGLCLGTPEIVACAGATAIILRIMPTTPLSSALKSKQKEGKLSIAALAKAIGANVQSVTGVLKGKSSPNKTTAPKYAKFLGLSADKFAALSKPAATDAGKIKAGTTAKAKAAVTSKAAKKKHSRRSASVRVSAAIRSTTPRSGRDITLAEAAELASDTLALAVYRASVKQRQIITAVLTAS